MGAIESLPHLGGEIVERQAECLAALKQADLDFLLAGAEGIGDVEHAGILGEFLLQLVGGDFQRILVAPFEAEVERVAGGKHIGNKGLLQSVGNRPHPPAPAVADPFGADLAAGGEWRQIHHHFGGVACANPAAAATRPAPGRPGADDGHHAVDRAFGGAWRGPGCLQGVEIGFDFRGDFQRRRLDQADGRFGHPHRHAGWHFHGGVEDVAFHRGHELENDPAAKHQRQGDHDDAGGDRPGHIAEFKHPLQRAAVAMLGEILQRVGDPALEGLPFVDEKAVFAKVPLGFAVGDVAGEDELRLNQTREQAEHHHAADGVEERAHLPAEQQNRQKRGDGCQHAENHRHRNLQRAFDGGLLLAEAAFFK